MRRYRFPLAGACLFLFLCPPAHGQTPSKAPCGDPKKTAEDKEPIAIVEIGTATSWNLSGGAATFAPSLAAEVTPIENYEASANGAMGLFIRRDEKVYRRRLGTHDLNRLFPSSRLREYWPLDGGLRQYIQSLLVPCEHPSFVPCY